MSDTQTYVATSIQWAIRALERAKEAVLTDKIAELDWRYVVNELEEALDETRDALAISEEVKNEGPELP